MINSNWRWQTESYPGQESRRRRDKRWDIVQHSTFLFLCPSFSFCLSLSVSLSLSLSHTFFLSLSLFLSLTLSHKYSYFLLSLANSFIFILSFSFFPVDCRRVRSVWRRCRRGGRWSTSNYYRGWYVPLDYYGVHSIDSSAIMFHLSFMR